MSRIASDELVLRYLDGAATSDEVAALEARMRADPEARRAFVRMSHLHALASELARTPLAAAPPRLRRRWAAGAAAAAAALALVIWSLAPARARGPMLTRCEGDVGCQRAGRVVPVAAGARLAAGDSLRLSAGARVEIAWSDGAVVSAAERGEFAIGAAADGGGSDVRLRLVLGALAASVVHDPRRPFAIATPEATVSDTGTRFTVTRDRARTCIAVAQGEVSVSAGAATIPVHAGERAIADAGHPPRLAGQAAAAAMPASVADWERPLTDPLGAAALPESLRDAAAWRVEGVERLSLPAAGARRPIGRRGKREDILGSVPMPDLGDAIAAVPGGLSAIVVADAAAGREWMLIDPEPLRSGEIVARELHEQRLGESRALPLLGGVLLDRDLRGEHPHALAVALPRQLLDGRTLRIGGRLAAKPETGGGVVGRLLASHGAWIVADRDRPTLFIEPRLAREAEPRARIERLLREAVTALRLVESDDDGP